ncbi:calcium-dependent lipid-binding (CaLB domain) plant phosphoribosyltransferase family protein [Actinidia rufa]|uniref:Calcium-dependent lipid-binding (CaLB domain) plant phosphoribosyltransferase family protein n=1 Tax=Actinidia rufa TaxID=165716 RepID=A0A7J0E270_9ERIC|nr:calcium-dependent lipid-binding (CaLB domain) plant phosphoribosyltransferase family protein [Actinidia rufa]
MMRPPREDFALKETKPHLGGGKVTGDKLTSTYDLVEQMQYLYVRVVKAKDLPGKDVTGGCDPYAEVKLGNYKGTTRHFEKKSNPEWNQVFAFSKDRLQASMLEVTVKDKDFVKDDFMGRVLFDLNEVPKRVPPDSPLAPQWYRLEDRSGNKAKGELMLAVWMGTQADEAFPEAWHSDAAAVSGADGLANIQSKVYLSPKLWYLRVNVIEAQDLQPSDKSRFPEVFVKAILGNQALRTRISMSKNINPMWNEDLMFVAAEPFEEPLILSVEDRVAPNKEEVLGRCAIPLQYVDRRLDHKPINSRWYNLEKHIIVEGEKKKEVKFASRIHMRICLEGGYHVLDESTHHSSDLKPTAKQLWKSNIGVLELGILNAHGWRPRHPSHMDTRLSCADNAHPDELDEEFDTFPTSRPNDIVRMRYDRLRSIAGRIQTVVGDLATQGERLQSLLSWRDPRASALFVIFCLVAAIVLYVTPFQVVALLAGFYVLRHPRFRHKLPSVPLNFFRRLPARTDCML